MRKRCLLVLLAASRWSARWPISNIARMTTNRRSARQGRAHHRGQLRHWRGAGARIRRTGGAPGAALQLARIRGARAGRRNRAATAGNPCWFAPICRNAARRVVSSRQPRPDSAALDVLINNAGGLGERRPITEVDDALFDLVYDLNVRSIIATTQAAIPHFEKARRRQHHQCGFHGGHRRRWRRRQRVFQRQGGGPQSDTPPGATISRRRTFA